MKVKWAPFEVKCQKCHQYIDGLAKDCGNSIANALEILQSCPNSTCTEKVDSEWKSGSVKSVLSKSQFTSPSYIEAETKWLTFCSLNFQTYFLQWKAWISIKISLKFVPWSLILYTIGHHWFRSWIGANQVTCHYLSLWCLSLLSYIRITRPHWVNSLRDVGH